MRTKVELLQLLLDNIEGIGKRGLCSLIWKLTTSKSISIGEEKLLEGIIDSHTTPLYDNTGSLYYFPAGEEEPRIKYLKQLIKKI